MRTGNRGARLGLIPSPLLPLFLSSVLLYSVFRSFPLLSSSYNNIVER